MSIHISAEIGQIAPTVLMPGDPLRAQFFAETFLEDAVCFNRVRGMLGYTGTFSGKRVSTMGSGMGAPSFSIYMNELVREYDVKTVIRVGTCGALQPDLEIGDVILAIAASTDSHINRLQFGGVDYAPHADFGLLSKAHDAAWGLGSRLHVGSVVSSDIFYPDDPASWDVWAKYGVLAIEMETSALYTIAAKHKVAALSILTVSNSLVTHMEAPAKERERGYSQMAEIALSIIS